MDPLVRITNVSDVAGIDPHTLAPNAHTKVVYMVGDHGPFTLVTPSREFTADYVNAKTQETVDHLRALGAVK